MSAWHQVALDRGDGGVRIDRVLLRHLAHRPELTRTRLQRLIAAGAVHVNGRPVTRVAARVTVRDAVAILLPAPRPKARPQPETLPVDVRYEDDDLLIVNKPAGQVSHPAFRQPSGTLLNGLLALAGDRWTPALLTRLDKDTSGLVLVAKSRPAQAALQRLVLRGSLVKEYLAIVAGRPPLGGTIALSLGRDPMDRRRMTVNEAGGRASTTWFERVRTLDTGGGGRRALLRCRLVTGRTHQLRVHLAASGWPIVGDRVYGRRFDAAPRQALHAWRLAFTHPLRGHAIDVTAPIPEDMQRLIGER